MSTKHDRILKWLSLALLVFWLGFFLTAFAMETLPQDKARKAGQIGSVNY